MANCCLANNCEEIVTIGYLSELIDSVKESGEFSDCAAPFIDISNNDKPYVEIGGMYWATMNVGANSVTDIGLYFAWGETIGYSASEIPEYREFTPEDYIFMKEGECENVDCFIKYNDDDGLKELELVDDAANANMLGDWRVPSLSDYENLLKSTNSAWTDSYLDSGVAGIILTDKTDSSKKLFFPAGGDACGSIGGVNLLGSYMVNSLSEEDELNTINFDFKKGGYTLDMAQRYCGMSVRGVIDVFNNPSYGLRNGSIEKYIAFPNGIDPFRTDNNIFGSKDGLYIDSFEYEEGGCCLTTDKDYIPKRSEVSLVATDLNGFEVKGPKTVDGCGGVLTFTTEVEYLRYTSVCGENGFSVTQDSRVESSITTHEIEINDKNFAVTSSGCFSIEYHTDSKTFNFDYSKKLRQCSAAYTKTVIQSGLSGSIEVIFDHYTEGEDKYIPCSGTDVTIKFSPYCSNVNIAFLSVDEITDCNPDNDGDNIFSWNGDTQTDKIVGRIGETPKDRCLKFSLVVENSEESFIDTTCIVRQLRCTPETPIKLSSSCGIFWNNIDFSENEEDFEVYNNNRN